jgi:hypothetical protein
MTIEFDGETQTVKVDGAMISLDALKLLANPNPVLFYRFVRVSETVFIRSFASREEIEDEFTAKF